MHPNNEPDRVHSELIDELFAVADKMDEMHAKDSELVPIVTMWIRREGHLAVERAYAERQATGLPEDSAWFLAVDDPGFQIGRAHV